MRGTRTFFACAAVGLAIAAASTAGAAESTSHGQREAPGIRAVQTDFVWGFRLACPMTQMPVGPSWCANVTSGK